MSSTSRSLSCRNSPIRSSSSRCCIRCHEPRPIDSLFVVLASFGYLGEGWNWIDGFVTCVVRRNSDGSLSKTTASSICHLTSARCIGSLSCTCSAMRSVHRMPRTYAPRAHVLKFTNMYLHGCIRMHVCISIFFICHIGPLFMLVCIRNRSIQYAHDRCVEVFVISTDPA